MVAICFMSARGAACDARGELLVRASAICALSRRDYYHTDMVTRADGYFMARVRAAQQISAPRKHVITYRQMINTRRRCARAQMLGVVEEKSAARYDEFEIRLEYMIRIDIRYGAIQAPLPLRRCRHVSSCAITPVMLRYVINTAGGAIWRECRHYATPSRLHCRPQQHARPRHATAPATTLHAAAIRHATVISSPPPIPPLSSMIFCRHATQARRCYAFAAMAKRRASLFIHYINMSSGSAARQRQPLCRGMAQLFYAHSGACAGMKVAREAGRR